MSLKLYEENDVQRLADTIRNKNGTIDKYKLSEMPEAVNNIRTAEDLDTELTALETEANDLDLEIDKLPDRYAGQYNVKQIINGDECRLEINEAPTERYYANKLNSIIDGTVTELTEQDLMGVTRIGDYAFYKKNTLSSITIPDSVTSIGSEAFSRCSNLTSITIPDSVTSIGDEAFFYCRSLTSITIPNSVTSIGSYAFDGCSKLSSITIPDSVISIGGSAFYGCTSLTTITIPENVTSIGNQAFYYCSSLSSVTYKGQAPNIQSSTFGYCSKVQLYDFRNCTTVPSLYSTSTLGHKSGCQIVIPDALYDEWQQATNWSSLTDVVWVKSSEYVEVI